MTIYFIYFVYMSIVLHLLVKINESESESELCRVSVKTSTVQFFCQNINSAVFLSKHQLCRFSVKTSTLPCFCQNINSAVFLSKRNIVKERQWRTRVSFRFNAAHDQLPLIKRHLSNKTNLPEPKGGISRGGSAKSL